MAVTAEALRELHHLHEQLAELRNRVERGPKQIRIREANVAQLKEKVDEAKAKVQETQMAINRKQLDLKAGEQKMVDAKVKLNAASSNKEYQALVEQIAAAERLVQRAMTDELPELCNQIASGEKLSEDDVERVRNTTAEAVAELLEEEQKRES